jgi:O-antigen ligase
MIRKILLLLFIALIGSRAFGLDLGLGPGLSIKNALVYATAILIAIDSAIARNRNVELLPVFVPFAALIFYAIATWVALIVFVEDPYYLPRETLIRLKTKLVDQFIVLFIFFYGVTNWKDALWLMKGLIWVVVTSCFVTVIDSFNIPDLGIITARDTDGRVEGVLGAAAEFGGLLAFFVPPIIALWWMESGLKKFVALIGIGMALISILISGSRGAMLGLVAGCLITAVYLRSYVSMRIAARAAIAVVVFAAAAVIIVISTEFGTMVEERLATGLDTGSLETISSGRTTIWLKAYREMAEHPHSFVTGLGWEAYFQTAGHRYATHNVYLDRIYNLGLIGLTLYLLTFVNAVRILRRGLAKTSIEALPYQIATIAGLAAIVLAMAFTDIEMATLYVWAFAALALRIATLVSTTSTEAEGNWRPLRGPAFDHTRATRPISDAPNRYANRHPTKR